MIYFISIENNWLPRLDILGFTWFVMPPNIISFSYDSLSLITVAEWFPSLHSWLQNGTYLTCNHAFWSRRNRYMSSKNGIAELPQSESFLPPKTTSARFIGKKLMVWPVRPLGGIPCYFIFCQSTDKTLSSDINGFKYLSLFKSSPLEFLPPKK